MFTQCPECQIAFRVTAKVLQQASGNVRCGNCGHAFNALHYLSEEMPVKAGPADDETVGESTRDDLAETSRRLLETLDELAGPDDVRIEDTGVEWRVLAEAAADTEQSRSTEASRTELRFDDNTPLPAEFDEDAKDTPLPDDNDTLAIDESAPQQRDADPEFAPAGFEERQGEFALSEAEDWTDILDEVRGPEPDALEVEEELAAIHTGLAAQESSIEEDIEDDIEVDIEDECDDPVLAPGQGEEPAAEDILDAGEVGAVAAPREVPQQTAAEMTVNMEIDAELLAAATQDGDFTATLVGIENPEELFDEHSGEVETIIMEGEFVRSAVEVEQLDADDPEAKPLDEPVNLADTYALSRGKVRGGRRSYDLPPAGVISAIGFLALLLAAQFVHNSRQSLATYGFFNSTIAPIYRVLGAPVTPQWDIKGWQFETTSGSVNEEETALTIVSRIDNRSGKPLPYPLVHVSLTNRWEDIMGSRILEPGEYLAGDIDPSQPVLPGEKFTAIITIEQPSAEATGFKLNVCYRVKPGTVRCAIEDFKN